VADRTIPFPAHLVRWLTAPAAVGTLLTAFTSLLRRTREPALPRMSDEWLSAHNKDSGRYTEY
jgi:hypothetical protein